MYLKDPAARLDYGLDWSDWLNPGAAIETSDWTVEPEEPEGLTVASSARQENLCLVVLEGGRAGRIYRVTNLIGLADGTADQRSIVIRVDHR